MALCGSHCGVRFFKLRRPLYTRLHRPQRCYLHHRGSSSSSSSSSSRGSNRADHFGPFPTNHLPTTVCAPLNCARHRWLHYRDFLPRVCTSCYRKSPLLCCLQLHLVGHSRWELFSVVNSFWHLNTSISRPRSLLWTRLMKLRSWIRWW